MSRLSRFIENSSSEDVSSIPKEFTKQVRFAYEPIASPHTPPMMPTRRATDFSTPARHRNSRLGRCLGRVDLWKWEIVGLSIALGAMATIVVLMAYSDGKLPRVYPYGISLNGIIAILSTICKGAMLSTVGLCLGQMKWSLFTNTGHPRPLEEFNAVEQASHGVVGSLRSLPVVWRMPLIFAGVVITIIAVGFDFAIQQIIALVPQPVQPPGEFGHTTIPRVQIFNYNDSGNQQARIPQIFAASDGLVATIENGVGKEPAVLDIKATCPTGNCTYPVFNTLAMSSTCVNITDQIKINSTFREVGADNGTFANSSGTSLYTTKWIAPGGIPIYQHVSANEPSNGTLDMTWMISRTSWTQFPALGLKTGMTPPLGMTVLKFAYSSNASKVINQKPTGWQCAIVPCVKTLNVSVVNGVQAAKVVSTWTNLTALGDWLGNFAVKLNPPPQTNLSTDPNNPPSLMSNFSIGSRGMMLFFQTLSSYFNGTFTLDDQRQIFTDTSTSNLRSGRGPYYLNTTNDIPGMMSDVADALTTFLRRAMAENATAQVQGTATVDQVFIQIKWAWLALPGLLLVASAFMLPATAMYTAWKKAPVWKDSSLPMLFHGLDEWSLPIMYQGPKETREELNRVAKNLAVELRRDVDGRTRLMANKTLGDVDPI